MKKKPIPTTTTTTQAITSTTTQIIIPTTTMSQSFYEWDIILDSILKIDCSSQPTHLYSSTPYWEEGLALFTDSDLLWPVSSMFIYCVKSGYGDIYNLEKGILGNITGEYCL